VHPWIVGLRGAKADNGRCAAGSIRLLCVAAVVIGEQSRFFFQIS
jgi:hypothetical protein